MNIIEMTRWGTAEKYAQMFLRDHRNIAHIKFGPDNKMWFNVILKGIHSVNSNFLQLSNHLGQSAHHKRFF